MYSGQYVWRYLCETKPCEYAIRIMPVTCRHGGLAFPLQPGVSYAPTKSRHINHQFNQDMNGFLKWDNLGKGDHTPILTQLFGDYQRDSRRKLSIDP